MTKIRFYKKSAAFRFYFRIFLAKWHEVNDLREKRWAGKEEMEKFHLMRNVVDDLIAQMDAVILTHYFDMNISMGDYEELKEFISYLSKKLWTM